MPEPLIEFCSNKVADLRPEVFSKKAILKNFTIFTGKHQCWSLSLEAPTQVFSGKYCELLI